MVAHLDRYVVEFQRGSLVDTDCLGGMTDIDDIPGNWRCERLDSEEVSVCCSI